ncbi:MAG: sulfatase/phosphatase domain-containing protein, partial [Opitutaceae bacterium]
AHACPEILKRGTVVHPMVANIDIAPTMLQAAGLMVPAYMEGKSFLPLARGEAVPWREYVLYEYYWERNYPMTPTMHALRGNRYKYIRYTGLWDTDELYDLAADPRERNNLIGEPGREPLVQELNRQLFEILQATGGMQVPLLPDAGKQQNLRRRSGSKQADFPEHVMRNQSRDN